MCRCDALWFRFEVFVVLMQRLQKHFSLSLTRLCFFPFVFVFAVFFSFAYTEFNWWYSWIRCTQISAPAFAAIFRSNDENKKLFIKYAGRLYSFIFYIQLWNLLFGLQNQIIHQNKWSHHRLFSLSVCSIFSSVNNCSSVIYVRISNNSKRIATENQFTRID